MAAPARPHFLRAPLVAPGVELRRILRSEELALAPGASDALTAKLIEAAGFPVVYVTGAGVANSQLGVPDVGLTSMDDVLRVIRAVTGVTNLPVLADGDAGYGNETNVARTVREFERAGAAGIQLEDQVTPKKCGHFDGKQVISATAMVRKLHAAQFARADPSFVIVARTDALAVHGIEDALARARLYSAAGADAIFVEAPRSMDTLRRIASEAGDAPKIANMVEGGKTPIVSAAELQAMGFSLVLYANLPLRAAMHGIRRALTHLQTNGSSLGIEHEIASMDVRQKAVGLGQLEDLERFLQGRHSVRPLRPRTTKASKDARRQSPQNPLSSGESRADRTTRRS